MKRWPKACAEMPGRALIKVYIGSYGYFVVSSPMAKHTPIKVEFYQVKRCCVNIAGSCALNMQPSRLTGSSLTDESMEGLE